MKTPSSHAAVLSAGECKRQSASTDRRLCDAALSVYSTLPTEAWRGFRPFPGGEIVFPNANVAREYLAAATHAAQVNRDPVGAIRLLDVSIRLDYIDVLETGDNLLQRVEAHNDLGKDEPRRSILLYHLGCIFGRMKLWSAAGRVCSDLEYIQRGIDPDRGRRNDALLRSVEAYPHAFDVADLVARMSRERLTA